MEYKEDHLSGKIFAETLTVLGWTRMLGCKRKYLIRCSVCAEDQELFADGTFETSKESLDRGYKPCGCGNAYRYTEVQYKILMQRKSQELGVVFNGWTEPFHGGQTKCEMSCEEGNWTPTIANFLHRETIKFNRGKARKDDHEIIKKFFDTGLFHEDTIFSRYRLYNKWYWKVECPVCGESGVSQSQHLQRGCRPCACGNYKQKFSYIHGIYDGDNIVAIKFGITRSKDLRIKYQARKTAYEIRSLGVWEYPDKHNCVSAERACLARFVCGILNKEEFGDGWTETTFPFNIVDIIEVYESYGGVKL